MEKLLSVNLNKLSKSSRRYENWGFKYWIM